MDRKEIEDYVSQVRPRKWNIPKLEFVGFLAGSVRRFTLRERAGAGAAKASREWLSVAPSSPVRSRERESSSAGIA